MYMQKEKRRVKMTEELKNKESIVESKSIIEQIQDEPLVNPFVSVYEDENNYFLTANMPGVKKENIQIKIEKEDLIIVGKINLEEKANRKYVFREIPIANYYRKFHLAETIDSTKVEANYADGVLQIKLPKVESIKPREIKIN